MRKSLQFSVFCFQLLRSVFYSSDCNPGTVNCKLKTLFLLLLSSHFLLLTSFSQNTTIGPTGTNLPLTPDVIMRDQKVLIIPFEPKLYMSEIDKKVNGETKMSFDQIRNTFRTGLDELLFIQFKSSRISVYALLNDSAGNAKDVERVYGSIGYNYDLVPTPNTAPEELNKQKQPENNPKIQKGQLAVMANEEKKFMNTKIIKPELLPYLHKKYGSSLFVFVNELDIKNVPESYDVTTDSYKREITVHYTVVDKDGKYVNYGIASATFSSNLNDPEQIIKTYFPQLCKDISDKLVLALTPKPEKK